MLPPAFISTHYYISASARCQVKKELRRAARICKEYYWFFYAKMLREDMHMLLDKMRGGLLGLAAGDALGVPVEFC